MRISFTEELAQLEAALQEEGDLVLRALRSSLNALARGDEELADEVISFDDEVDRRYVAPYRQAGENAMRFPPPCPQVGGSHKLHSATATTGINLIPGKMKPSAGIPAFACSPRKLSRQPGPPQSAGSTASRTAPACPEYPENGSDVLRQRHVSLRSRREVLRPEATMAAAILPEGTLGQRRPSTTDGKPVRDCRNSAEQQVQQREPRASGASSGIIRVLGLVVGVLRPPLASCLDRDFGGSFLAVRHVSSSASRRPRRHF